MNTPGAVRIAATAGLVTVDGALVFDTVPDVLAQTRALCPTSGSFAIDLGAVTHADSAALALLVEWRRLSRQRGVALELRALPAQLRALATACGLDALIDPA